MPDNHRDTREISGVIEQLAASTTWLERHSELSPTQHLPSREEVHDVIELLRSLLFPGYFGLADVTEPFLHYRLGSLLDEAMKRLRVQIHSSLCFSCANPADLPGCEVRADQALTDFVHGLPAIKQLLKEDVREAYEGDPACASEDEAIYCYPGIQAVTNYRIAHSLSQLSVPLLPRIITEQAHSITGIDLHPGAVIGEGIFIDHGTGVVVGETCIIGKRVKIYQGVTLGARSFPLDKHGNPIKGIPRHPTIEDDVVIYAGATILGHIKIGKGSVIGGNVWLTHSVPPHSRIFQKPPKEEMFESGAGI
jgi:serine O-acetyltransferase